MSSASRSPCNDNHGEGMPNMSSPRISTTKKQFDS
jgi:hypothetical protein